MARSWDSAGDEITTSDLDDRFTSGGTEFQWFFVRDASGQSAAGSRIIDIDGSTGFDYQPTNASGGLFEIAYVGSYTTTQGIWSYSAQDFTEDVWQSHGVDYTSGSVSNNPSAWANGTKKTVGSGLVEDTTPVGTYKSDAASTKRIGNNSSNNRTLDGNLAYWTTWNTVLADVKQEALSRGVNPFIIDNANIVMHLPLLGDISGIRDWGSAQPTLSHTGTVKATINPPVELIENYL